MKKTFSRLLLMSSVGLLLMGAGTCHPVGLYENYFLDRLARDGFVQRTIALGPDTVTYWDNGKQKPTLLLAHGFGGGGTWSWTKQLETLGQHYRVIAPDFLWFHNSHSKERDFSLEHQTRMLLSLLDHLKIQQTHLLGTSYGGLVSYMLAMKAPERVNKIVFAASPGPDYHAKDYDEMCERLGIKHMGELLLVETADDLKFLMDSIYYKPKWLPRWVRERLVNTHYKNFRQERTELLTQLIKEQNNIVNQTEIIPHEALLLYGEFDLLFPVSLGERYKAYLGESATLKVIPDTRHVPQIENDEVFNKYVIDFLGVR